MKHDGEVVDDLLGAADGEGRHEDFAAGGDDCFDDGLKLRDSIGVGPMIVIAVGGFHEDEIGLGDGFKVAEDGAIGRAEVAGEHHGLGFVGIVDREFDTGGTEHVTGFEVAGGDAGGDFDGLVKLDRSGECADQRDIIGTVDRFKKRRDDVCDWCARCRSVGCERNPRG
ncbi:MAG: hypothetical protein J6386_09490 [Candidatus Synoicihabitans palmerolidicus]|nr:hypothetical protein [Candidatus Synoicihabitans palmerolidicus]